MKDEIPGISKSFNVLKLNWISMYLLYPDSANIFFNLPVKKGRNIWQDISTSSAEIKKEKYFF